MISLHIYNTPTITAIHFDIRPPRKIQRDYKNLSVQMGFSGLEGGILRSTEALPRYCRNSHARSENFRRLLVTSDSFFFLHIIFKNKNRNNGFNVCVIDCIILAYEFTHSFI